MKFGAMLLCVRDLARSTAFYQVVLGLPVTDDFGANITLGGVLSLQTFETWTAFLQKEPGDVSFGANNAEVYFEEEQFDAFLEKLESLGVETVHPPLEQNWGQRAVRFYDPDRHIIEVGESMSAVVRRFSDSGLSIPEIAKRMDVPAGYVASQLAASEN